MAKRANYVPAAGDIILVNFSPQVAHEQAGNRPALVVSEQEFNKVTGLAVCCPITHSKRRLPFETELPKGLKTTGVILCEHLKSLAWKERKAALVERAPLEIVEEVRSKIAAIISIAE